MTERQEHRAVAETQARRSQGTQRICSITEKLLGACPVQCSDRAQYPLRKWGSYSLVTWNPIPCLRNPQRPKRDVWSQTSSWSLTMPWTYLNTEITLMQGLRPWHQPWTHRLRGGSSGLVPGAGYGAQLSSTGVDGDGQGRYTALQSIRLRTWHTGYSTWEESSGDIGFNNF